MIEVIPAIDIIEGKCVRLTQGDYDRKKIYNDNPLEVAKQFEDVGINRIHVVDLDGAKAKHIVNDKVLKSITSNTNLKVDFGGGVKSDEDIKKAFDSGAYQITAGSIAVSDMSRVLSWIEQYGSEKIILGADAIDRQIATHGWQENSGIDLIDFVQGYIEKGNIQYTICTDVGKDGLLQGPSFDIYNDLQKSFADLKVIASGGVKSMDDIKELDKMNVYGVIVGKAIYEGFISIEDLMQFSS